jgi:uncharacterized protein involved in exopolysaccharide biosynthesis
MNRREIVALLFRERWKIALVLLLPVMAAVGLYFWAPRTYQAEAKILIRVGREVQTHTDVGQPTQSMLQSSTQQELTNSEMELVHGRDIANMVLQEFGTSTLFPGLDADRTPDLRPSDNAVKAFSGALGVAAVNKSLIFTVTYEAPTPELATKVLDRVLELYQKKHVDAYAHPISSFLNTQLEDLEKKIESYDAQATEFKVAHQIYDPTEERRLLLNTRSGLAETMAQARSHMAELAKRIDVLTELRRQTPGEIKMYAESVPSDAIERARADLLSLRVQEQKDTNGYLDSSRTMIKLRNQIDTVNKFLANEGPKFSGHVRTGRNPLYDELTAEIARTEAQIAPEDVRVAGLQKEIDRIDARLNTIEEGAQTLDVLRRQRENLQTALSSFRQQQEQAGLLEEMDKQKIVNVQVVENPAPVSFDKPAHPQKRIYAAAGLAGGILLAILWIGLMFATHNTFLTPEAVEESVNLPVLASLSARHPSP